MRRFLVWNPSKLSIYCNHTPTYSLDTLKGLREMEKHDDCSWSSIVETDDPEGFHQAVYNETDVDLCMKEIKVLTV